jgi:hypothetical protein
MQHLKRGTVTLGKAESGRRTRFAGAALIDRKEDFDKPTHSGAPE